MVGIKEISLQSGRFVAVTVNFGGINAKNS